MHLLPRPGARALLAAAMLLGAASITFAQQPHAQQPQPQTPPAAPATAATQQAIESTGPARPLSIEEAVQLALQQNLGIQVERLNPELQDYTIAQALATYTPIFGGAVNYTHQDQPPSSFLSGGEDTITSTNFGGKRSCRNSSRTAPTRPSRGTVPASTATTSSAVSTRS